MCSARPGREDQTICRHMDKPEPSESGYGVRCVPGLAVPVADQLLDRPGPLVVVNQEPTHNPGVRRVLLMRSVSGRLFLHGELRPPYATPPGQFRPSAGNPLASWMFRLGPRVIQAPSRPTDHILGVTSDGTTFWLQHRLLPAWPAPRH